MDKITESLTWLLGDFRNGVKNYEETILEIKRIYARELGLVLYEDFDKALKKEIERTK